MKKILALAVVIATFLIMPSLSSAQKIAIADSELSAISAQYGSVTATWSDPITIKGTNLSPTITNFQDFWGHKVENADAWFGITDISVNDATFQRNGSVTEQVFLTDDPNIWSKCKLHVTINSLSLSSSDFGLNQTIKLGTKSDLTTWSDGAHGGTQLRDQVLGQSYMGGIAATVSGSVTIYARNNTWVP